jgi:hypothetical protein
MRKEIDYEIIENEKLEVVVIEVKKAQSEGWFCQGGIIWADGLYTQAMVKYEEVIESIPLDKSEHQSRPKKEKTPVAEVYIELAKKLRDKIKSVSPEFDATEAKINSWGNDFRMMVELDKVQLITVSDLIDTVYGDSFWCKVIRSAGKLRERYKEGKLTHLKSGKSGNVSSW